MPTRSRKLNTRSGEDAEETEAASAKEGSPLSEVLLRERAELHRWKETIEVRTPNLLVPRQIAGVVNAHPFCKLAVAPHGDHIAFMSHRRIFEVYEVTRGELERRANVQVLEDSSAEFCLFEYSASGALLLSTRSDASIDVFDRNGLAHCYTIIPELLEWSADLVSVISSLSSVAISSSGDKFTDKLFVLHFNSMLSCFKIGRVSHFKLFTVQLECNSLSGVCRFLPTHSLLLVSSHFKIGVHEPPGGLTSYRVIDCKPHVVPVVTATKEQDWLGGLSARLPFAAFTYISSLTVDFGETKAVGITTTGDVYLFALPSLSLLASISHLSGVPPRIAAFVHDTEVAILLRNGSLIRCTAEKGSLEEAIAAGEKSSECESFSARTALVLPSERNLFILECLGGPEASIPSQRASLAARLMLTTVWRSLKQLLGMAVGEAAAPLQQATQLLALEFTLWHSPTVTLEELLNKTMLAGDYEKARQLAAVHPLIPTDLVYKGEWQHLVEKKALKAEHVRDILARIGDMEWKARRFLETSIPSLEVQRELITEGSRRLGDAPLQVRARLAHHGRLLSAIDDVELYVALREKPLRDVTLQLAERGELVALERLLTANWRTIGSSCLELLSVLPSAISPARYERLIPTVTGELPAGTKADKFVAELAKIEASGKEGREAVESVNGVGGKLEGFSESQMSEWSKRRAREIEEDTGLASHALRLIEVAVERGCQDLNEEVKRWRFFCMFIELTGSVMATFDFFLSASSSLLAQHFSAIDESTVVTRLGDILQILEWHSADDEHLHQAILVLLTAATRKSTRVLRALAQSRPELLDKDALLKALSELELTGNALLRSLQGLEVPGELKGALAALLEKGVQPTVAKLIASRQEVAKAKEIIASVLNASSLRTLNDWVVVTEDIVHLAGLVYSDLLTDEDALEMVGERFLFDDNTADSIDSLKALLQLDSNVLASKETTSSQLSQRLSPQRSAQLLLRVAQSMLTSALGGDEQLLGRARFLADAARILQQKEADSLLRQLEMVSLAAELGCGRLPIQIIHADPQALIEEVILAGENYKKGKRVARLAQLLRIETPVASAFANCALRAVEMGDEHTLAAYIKEVSSARGLLVVYQLCMKLLATTLLPNMRDEIIACALWNAPVEQLEAALNEVAHLEEVTEELHSTSPSPVPDLPLPSGIILDPAYTPLESWESEDGAGGNEQHGWASLARRRHQKTCGSGGGFRLVDAARLLATESATAAVGVAVWCDEQEAWTTTERLQRYADALRRFRPQLSPRVVQRISPQAMVDRLISGDDQSTPLDRLPLYGCERERFVKDDELPYRTESIYGLAMTEDDLQWSDAIALANSFHVEEWGVHLSSLENLLTSMAPSDARDLIQKRGHREVLLKSAVRYHNYLQKKVLPLISSDDMYEVYLEQFGPSTEENKSLLPLVRLLKDHGEANIRSRLRDEGTLQRLLDETPDERLSEATALVRSTQAGATACESAARSAVRARAPPARILSLVESPEALLEVIVDVAEGLEDELRWHLAQTGYPADYRVVLQRRLDEIVSINDSLPSFSVPSSGSATFSVIQRRRH